MRRLLPTCTTALVCTALLCAAVLPATRLAAQTSGTPAPSPAPAPVPAVAPAGPTARPADVATLDGIVAALYEVISGPAGQARDWDRMRSLFHPTARMTSTGPRRTGGFGARPDSVGGYIATSGPFFLREGFFERELARRTEQWGNLAQVWTTYEWRNRPDQLKPVQRGINSLQLFNDGTRWWIMNVVWASETPQNPLPSHYLTSPKP